MAQVSYEELMASFKSNNSELYRKKINDFPSDKKITFINHGTYFLIQIMPSRKTRREAAKTFTPKHSSTILPSSEYEGTKAEVSMSIERAQKSMQNKFYRNAKPNWQFMFVTFSYNAEHKTKNPAFIVKDFSRIIKNIRNNYAEKFGQISALYMIDPHEDMTLHIHAILATSNCSIPFYIPARPENKIGKEKSLQEMFKKGNVYVSFYADVDKMINYISPHPTDSQNCYAKHMNEKYLRLQKLPRKCKIYHFTQDFKNITRTRTTLGEFAKIAKEMGFDYTELQNNAKYTSFQSSITNSKMYVPYYEFIGHVDETPNQTSFIDEMEFRLNNSPTNDSKRHIYLPENDEYLMSGEDIF